ncbi:multisubstrate pseudouridine synthase 7 [Nicotiana tabacum]|uniref:Multisubstrate pseudouridine synthase 7 n=2 Tax=Nicotiana tabacum TaxID=4097 RepID=A0A1S3ZM61_TOBAC|nr:multisubstrate pseudouridine synthase 7 isoform X1 [Nicotiana tomentosiformis]XP_016465389.1 PREDICTED: multisubstrate pseudouridine synthase 7-like [Nicotiana tabacum]
MLKTLCSKLRSHQQLLTKTLQQVLGHPKILKHYNSFFDQSLLPATMMKTMDESDVGISCYISKLPGFRGILKQRYSDFIVNEVDLDGNVVHLTSLEAPAEVCSEDKDVNISDQLNKSYVTEIESFRSLAGNSDADKLKGLIDKLNSGVDVSDESVVLSPSSDKLHRTAIHNFFKERLKFLVTDAVDGPEDSSKCVRVRLNKGGNNGRGRFSRKRKDRNDKPYDSRGSDSWPEHLGKFLRFHLFKENKDTQEALNVIAKMLGVQPRSFGFAGTKDKRAVSTQRVTVFKQRASRVAALNERLIGIKVGDFCHVKEGLLLGQLYGNRFTITLRGVSADSEDIIKASAVALGELGFINYFGLQRFGSSSVPTHLIGAALLRGEWKAAVSLILDPREGEKNAISTVREYYKESGDIDGTLRQLPRHLVAERAILQCLKKSPGNCLQALKGIPRTLRMMYVHSYQSYLWNHAASMRVQKHGFDQVVLGDLVYSKEQPKERETFVAECEDVNGNNMDDYSNLDETSETDLPEEKNISVKAINEEDLISGTYTIEDVLLPLPGSRVIYPSNDIGEVYCDLAQKDGISLTETAHKIKEFSITNMTGAYRRVFQKPKDFEWELLSYTDGTIPLAETDFDVIAKSVKKSKAREDNSANGSEELPADYGTSSATFEGGDMLPGKSREEKINSEARMQSEESQSGGNAQESQMALKLSFTLPASCYATMAVRELLKTSTSVAFHKSLNE